MAVPITIRIASVTCRRLNGPTPRRRNCRAGAIGADVTGAVFHAYRVFALPTQFFIDPNGDLRQVVNGPLSEERAAQLIESILPAGSSSVATQGAASPP
jgi:hypothetical protein